MTPRELFKQLLEQRGLNATQVADATGQHSRQSALSRWLSDPNRQPRISTLTAVAKALGIPADALLTDEAATRAALQAGIEAAPSNGTQQPPAIYKIERKPSLELALSTLIEHLAAATPTTRKSVLAVLGQFDGEPGQAAELVGQVKLLLESGKRLATKGAAPESIGSPN